MSLLARHEGSYDHAPDIPAEFQIYNSHKVDPIYQRKFTIVWVSVAVFFILVALPNFVRYVRTGRVRDGLGGLRRDENAYERVDTRKENAPSAPRQLAVFNVLSLVKAATMWTFSVLGLDVGQLVLIFAYYITVLLCTTLKAELIDNPNRPGYLAVTQLVPVFLLASKNSPVAVLLSSGYEKLNFLHRWCSRGALLAAAVHGLLWMWNHYEYGLPIIRKRKKDVTGLAALACLCILGLTSLRPVRARFYQLFRVLHLLTVPLFAIAMRFHTKHSIPYLYPAVAFWGLDLFLRIFRLRIRRATLIAPDTQMTIIRVSDCTSGWSAGQHVRLRVFFGYRMFESHPFTIMNAPQSTTCLAEGGVGQELILGARVRGDWTRALNVYARESGASFIADIEEDADVDTEDSRPLTVPNTSKIVDEDERDDETIKLADLSKSSTMTEPLLSEVPNWSPTDRGPSVRVTLDGPYGGLPFDIGSFHSVLLISGGSGITFTLALLDDLVGRCLRLGRQNGEVTQRIEFVWYIRSFSAIRWVAPFLSTIASRASTPESTLNLHINIYITRSSNTEPSNSEELALPSFPNCDITFSRPRVHQILNDLLSAHQSRDVETSAGYPDYKQQSFDARSSSSDLSVAACSAGPISLVYEVKNVTARFALRNPRRRVECHTEVYSL